MGGNMKDLCPGCACWIEDGWSYCMQCGRERSLPPRRPSVTLSCASSSDGHHHDVYGSKKSVTRLKQVSTPPKERGKRKLLRRRESSDEVRHQLQQWRARLKAQEDLLKDLERSNTVTQQAAAIRTASDLRRVVQDGRALVRSWSQRETLATLMMPKVETRRRKGRRKLPAVAVAVAAMKNPTCSPNDTTTPTRGEMEDIITSHPHARPAIAEDVLTLSQEQRPNDNSSVPSTIHRQSLDFPTALDPAQDEDNLVPTKGGELPRHKGGGGTLDIDKSSGHGSAAAADSNGWFWGANGPPRGDDVDASNSNPGEGAMGVFWRKAKVGGATALDPHVTLPDTRHDVSTIPMRHRESPRQGPSQHVAGQSTAKLSTADGHHGRDRPQRNRHNSGAFIGVASTKAAVRSASNRAAELSRLLAEGNNPPREECLAKAESAVRAAQLAVSCSNERVFELELMVGATAADDDADPAAAAADDDDGTDCHGKEKRAVTKSGVVVEGMDVGVPGDKYNERGHPVTATSSSLSLHIAQLTKQMQLAQSLQAASLAARARLTRRFAREDDAATLLQAHVRGFVARSRESSRKKGSENQKRRMPRPSVQAEIINLSRADEETRSASSSSSSANASTAVASLSANDPMAAVPLSPNNPGEGGEAISPSWEEEEWWTLAEEESADDVGDRENFVLGAVVKLQAIVRSRLARARTIADVNARFVEHFDEQYQHPFYVCTETNCSQWNRPFGFGVSLPGRDFSSSFNEEQESNQGGEVEESFRGGVEGGGHDAVAKKKVETATTSDDVCEQAAVVIQCAVRAARARGQLAERIVSASF